MTYGPTSYTTQADRPLVQQYRCEVDGIKEDTTTVSYRMSPTSTLSGGVLYPESVTGIQAEVYKVDPPTVSTPYYRPISVDLYDEGVLDTSIGGSSVTYRFDPSQVGAVNGDTYGIALNVLGTSSPTAKYRADIVIGIRTEFD